MSYDLELYTARKPKVEPPQIGNKGNILVDGPYDLEDDDIPESHLQVLSKRRVLSRIHLEGDLKPLDQSRVDVWLEELLRETKGVLIDLQKDRFETSSKSGQLDAHQDIVNDYGSMVFYLEDGEKFYKNGLEELLSEISHLLPEASPLRYGYYEPLQGRVDGNDFSELVSSFKEETDLFMKSKAPFGHIFMSIPCQKAFEKYHPKHFVRRKFLLGCINFEIRPKLFTQPAKLSKLQAFFERACVILNVVYAEIAVSGAHGNWGWYGLPDNQPHTICVGKRYQNVWPEVLESGHSIGRDHHIVSTDRLGNRPPRPPADMIAPGQDDGIPNLSSDELIDTRDVPPNYAKIFPFDFQFDLENHIW